MEKLTDIDLLLLADIFAAGDGGRRRNRLLTLVGGTGGRITSAIQTLEERGFIRITRVPNEQSTSNKHFITETGADRMREVLLMLGE